MNSEEFTFIDWISGSAWNSKNGTKEGWRV